MSEMTRLDDALVKILGVKPAFVRPPFGSYNDLCRQVAQENGQSIVIWDFDSGDSAGASVAQIEHAYQDIAERHPSTILTLNHDPKETTAQALDYALGVLTKADYRLVTVAECLGGLDPYVTRTVPTLRDVSFGVLCVFFFLLSILVLSVLLIALLTGFLDLLNVAQDLCHSRFVELT